MAVFLADEQQAVAVDGEDLVALARFVLADRGVPDDMEVSLYLVDEDTIAALNQHHMGTEGPTDVLAFPIDQPGETPPGPTAILGDIVLCPAVAARQASEHRHESKDELRVLAVHGLLHLLGMDHADAVDATRMFGLTDSLLAAYDQVARLRHDEAARLRHDDVARLGRDEVAT